MNNYLKLEKAKIVDCLFKKIINCSCHPFGVLNVYNKNNQQMIIVFVILTIMISFLPFSSIMGIIQVNDTLERTKENVLDFESKVKYLPKLWTCIVYLDADNNLDSYGVSDVNEMEMVGSSSQVNIIVLLDREHTGADVYYIEKDTSQVSITSSEIYVPGLPLEPNMGDPDTLETYVDYIMEMYPATNYLLDLWDHGSGWETYYEDSSSTDVRSKIPTKGICYDDTNGNDALNTDELGEVLANLPDKIDILSFDACLMAASELAYEYRNYVDYIVASEETIPGTGYDYEFMFRALVNDPYMTPREYSQVMVSKYSQAYATEPSTTLSAVDCSKMDAFATALDTFALAMIANMTSCVLGLFHAWMDVDYFTVLAYIELSHFCDLVMANVENSTIISAANSVKLAISNAVISEHHGNSHPQARGLTIYFPFIQAHYSDKYEERIDLTQATHWDEFLNAYWTAGGGGGLSFQQYIIDDDNNGLSHGNDNGVIDPGEVVEISVSVRNNGLLAATNVEGMLLTSDDYVYYTTFFCDFDDFDSGETHTSTNQFVLTIDSDCPPSNYFISFVFAIYSNEFGEQLFNNVIAVGISEVDGGGTFEEAIALTNGQTVSSTLNGTEPTDCIWFKVDVQAGNRLLVIMNGAIGTDFDMKVFSDNQAFLVGEGVLLSYPEVINVVTSKTTVYYIKIYSFEGAGNFSISIQITETGGVNYGSNIGSEAIPVETGSYDGLLPGPSAWGTVFYRFDGKANKKCTFTLTGPAGSIYDMTLYDEQGNELTWTTTLTSNYPVVMEYELDYDGRYYLEIESYTGSGAYTIEFDIPQGFLGGIDYYYWIVIAIIVISVILSILQSKGIINIKFKPSSGSNRASNSNNYQISNNQTSNYNNIGTTHQTSSLQISSRRRCPYCKTRLHPGQTKCPRCGK